MAACRRVTGITKFKYPFHRETAPGIGRVFLPLVSISLWLERQHEWVDFQFILDTGATASILPAAMAPLLGISLAKQKVIEMRGVEGSGVKSWLVTLTVRLKGKKLKIPCFLVDNEQVPFLLGRAGLLDREFSLLLDSKKQQINLLPNRC